MDDNTQVVYSIVGPTDKVIIKLIHSWLHVKKLYFRESSHIPKIEQILMKGQEFILYDDSGKPYFWVKVQQ